MGTRHLCHRSLETVSHKISSFSSYREIRMLTGFREYEKITYDYPLAAAKAFTSLSPTKPFKFVYVSGEGATTQPGRFSPFFGVVKGRAEAALLALSKEPTYPNLKPYSVRPGGVDPAAHPEIHDFVPSRKGLLGLVQKTALPVFRATWGAILSPTKELGKIMTDLAMGNGEPLEGKGVEGEGRTVTNAGFRRMAKLA
jgi:hypothetical protein